MNNTFSFRRFRQIAAAEGFSFLFLLFIAMPLKHFAGMPLAVKIAGSLHGVLFIAFVLITLTVKLNLKKGLGWFFLAFFSSLVPFGTFIMDKQWKKEGFPG